MSLADVAEQTLKGGDPVGALAHLQEQVRAKPADPKLRIFLFQLLCVVGQWERMRDSWDDGESSAGTASAHPGAPKPPLKK